MNFHTQNLNSSFEKLSSGLRINKASDDAVGLAISSSLDFDARVTNQGIKNINDGISYINIAESALTELNGIVIRLTELAQQAATSALSNTQRKAIDAEAEQFKNEYNRIVQTTEFNNRKILKGDDAEIKIQGGFGNLGSINGSVGGKVGTGSFTLVDTIINLENDPASLVTGDFNLDGITDIISVSTGATTGSVLLGDGNGSFNRTQISLGSSPSTILKGDFNGDGVLDLVTADRTAGSVSIHHGDGVGNFSLVYTYTGLSQPSSIATGDFNNDGLLDFVLSNASNGTGVTFTNRSDGTQFSQYTIGGVANFLGSEPESILSADFNGDGILDLASLDPSSDLLNIFFGNGEGDFTFESSLFADAGSSEVSSGDFNGDGILDLVTVDPGDNSISLFIGRGDGSFLDRTSHPLNGNQPNSIEVGDFNGDGALDIATAHASSDLISILLRDSSGGFSSSNTFSANSVPIDIAKGDFDGDGVLDLVVLNNGDNSMSIFKGDTRAGTAPILDFSLKTLADSRQALPMFKKKLNQLSAQRGEIGAFAARLATARSLLQSTFQNEIAASAQIKDVDVATESAKLVKIQIQQDSAQSILKQANFQPQVALRLLNDI